MTIIGTVKVIRVVFLEDEVWEGSIPQKCFEDARVEEFECETSGEAVAVLQREGLTFEATGNDWAADPDGSQITDYGTGERTETTGHLEGFSPWSVRAIIDRVG